MPDATIPVICPACHAKAKAPAGSAGRSVRCGECGEAIQVAARRATLVAEAETPEAPAEPASYTELEAVATSAYWLVFFFCCAGLLACVVLGVVATGKDGPGLVGVVGAGVVAAELIFVMLLAGVCDRLVKVFLDAARNVRSIRAKVEK